LASALYIYISTYKNIDSFKAHLKGMKIHNFNLLKRLHIGLDVRIGDSKLRNSKVFAFKNEVEIFEPVLTTLKDLSFRNSRSVTKDNKLNAEIKFESLL
jgi:hypothetical protein